NPAVGSVWARGHLRELEDRYVLGRGERSQLERRIVATSLGYGVLCRFTAYVAVDRSEVVNAGGQVQKLTQPVEAPAGRGGAGWDMLVSVREQQLASRGVVRLYRPHFQLQALHSTMRLVVPEAAKPAPSAAPAENATAGPVAPVPSDPVAGDMSTCSGEKAR